MDKVNIAEKFALFDDHWSPKIVGELNGQYVKLMTVKAGFVWHRHDVVPLAPRSCRAKMMGLAELGRAQVAGPRQATPTPWLSGGLPGQPAT